MMYTLSTDKVKRRRCPRAFVGRIFHLQAMNIRKIPIRSHLQKNSHQMPTMMKPAHKTSSSLASLIISIFFTAFQDGSGNQVMLAAMT